MSSLVGQKATTGSESAWAPHLLRSVVDANNSDEGEIHEQARDPWQEHSIAPVTALLSLTVNWLTGAHFGAGIDLNHELQALS